MVNKPFIRPAISWGVGIGLVVPLDFPRELPSTLCQPARGMEEIQAGKKHGFKFYMMKSLPCMGKLADPTPFFGIWSKKPPQRLWHRIFRPGKWNDAYACARHGVDPTP